jgi:hypothetical protein
MGTPDVDARALRMTAREALDNIHLLVGRSKRGGIAFRRPVIDE